jgi:hypothetical protein
MTIFLLEGSLASGSKGIVVVHMFFSQFYRAMVGVY